MPLFDHTIEYLAQGEDIKTAVVSYKDIFDTTCIYRFTAPSNLWTRVKIGGTMSAGGAVIQGIVQEVTYPRHKVVSQEGVFYCHTLPLHKPIQIGDPAIIFEHMQHSAPGAYGGFLHAMIANASEAIIDQLSLHSINIIVYNKNQQVGVIHIDPFTSTPNYDDMNLLLEDGSDWEAIDFYHYD